MDPSSDLESPCSLYATWVAMSCDWPSVDSRISVSTSMRVKLNTTKSSLSTGLRTRENQYTIHLLIKTEDALLIYTLLVAIMDFLMPSFGGGSRLSCLRRALRVFGQLLIAGMFLFRVFGGHHFYIYEENGK